MFSKPSVKPEEIVKGPKASLRFHECPDPEKIETAKTTNENFLIPAANVTLVCSI